MVTTSKRSLISSASFTIFALVICLSVVLERASAWKNICNPGDIYMDSKTKFTKPTFGRPPDCSFCTQWCESMCRENVRRPVLQDKTKCLVVKNTAVLQCQCCCAGSPPSPPLLNPPPPASQFEGDTYPYEYNICEGSQSYEKISDHQYGRDCIGRPLCESRCKAKGQSKTRSECVAAGQMRGLMFWYEQCCCGKIEPPPPPPSPPPPSPPPPSPSPPPPSPPPPPPSPPPPSSPPPPPPSPPPPSPPPPPPPSPPPPPTSRCTYMRTPTTDCSLCTRGYCTSECSARGASLVKTACSDDLPPCRCCCRSFTTLSSSTEALGSSLFAAML